MSPAANKTEQAIAAANAPATMTLLLPQLFMAARRGDSTKLKDLLKLYNGNSNQDQVTVEHVSAAPVAQVIDHRGPAAAAAPVSGLLDGVTIEGDSLLHTVTACGDDEKFLVSAKLLFCHNKGLLGAGIKKGDTPLHCTAHAGNENLVTCLVQLATTNGEKEVKELLRMQNKCGETGLHHAIRSRSKDVVDKLMSVDPELGWR